MRERERERKKGGEIEEYLLGEGFITRVKRVERHTTRQKHLTPPAGLTLKLPPPHAYAFSH